MVRLYSNNTMDMVILFIVVFCIALVTFEAQAMTLPADEGIGPSSLFLFPNLNFQKSKKKLRLCLCGCGSASPSWNCWATEQKGLEFERTMQKYSNFLNPTYGSVQQHSSLQLLLLRKCMPCPNHVCAPIPLLNLHVGYKESMFKSFYLFCNFHHKIHNPWFSLAVL